MIDVVTYTYIHVRKSSNSSRQEQLPFHRPWVLDPERQSKANKGHRELPRKGYESILRELYRLPRYRRALTRHGAPAPTG